MARRRLAEATKAADAACYALTGPCRRRMPIDYLQKILTAKVYDVAVETPLDARADAVARGSATACC